MIDRRWLALCFLGCLAFHSPGQALDALVSSPDIWQSPRAGFVDAHRDLGFYWLSQAADRAETHTHGLTFLSRPACEADADFQGDKLAGITIAIYDRGDAGDITREEMYSMLTYSLARLNALTGATYVAQGQEASDAVKAWAFTWDTPASHFALELSFTKEKSRDVPFRADFIRLHVTPAEKPKTFIAAALEAATPQAASTFDGPSHVQHNPSGDVVINTVPMVDQGEKGYCVVATAERVMRYYGVPVDENELAELANTSAIAGTSNAAMFDSLKKLSQRLRVKIRPLDDMDVRQLLDLIAEYNRRARRDRAPEISTDGAVLDMQSIYTAMKPELLKEARTHNKAAVDRFGQMVRDHIDQGIPILWSVMLGVVPEQKAPHVIGGHMRLIIGYNDQTGEILYSDSWGPGHELKRMPADDAWTMTTSMDMIEPL